MPDRTIKITVPGRNPGKFPWAWPYLVIIIGWVILEYAAIQQGLGPLTHVAISAGAFLLASPAYLTAADLCDLVQKVLADWLRRGHGH